eukprot:3206676-Rhodomonas_salina.3
MPGGRVCATRYAVLRIGDRYGDDRVQCASVDLLDLLGGPSSSPPLLPDAASGGGGGEVDLLGLGGGGGGEADLLGMGGGGGGLLVGPRLWCHVCRVERSGTEIA